LEKQLYEFDIQAVIDGFALDLFQGEERLGQPFLYRITMLHTNREIVLDEMVGSHMTMSMGLADDTRRYFKGVVANFRYLDIAGGYARYEAILRPWLWLLTRTSNCRIFQNLTAIDIIKRVFEDHGFADYEFKTHKSMPQREYCVQYRETDYDFVHRLLEEEGLYYYVQHDSRKHSVIFCAEPSDHDPIAVESTLPWRTKGTGVSELEYITRWSPSRQVQAGAYVIDDYDFVKPRADLESREQLTDPHRQYKDFELYDYPGRFSENSDGASLVKNRLQAQKAQYATVEVDAECDTVAAGGVFTFSEFHRAAEHGDYLIVGCKFDVQNYEGSFASSDGPARFTSTITALTKKTPFRPLQSTPIPRVHGPQTAVVTGASGEEIWTDEHGRIKVQFHWDREGMSDENTTCWIRVAQWISGPTWGSFMLPRIGQEVIVEFLEGDPDRPLVTGCVYNGSNKPPFPLPANQTQSGIRTRSSKDAQSDNFNELRFEDKTGEEQIYLHAEKDFDRVVENNDTLTVGLEDKDPGDQTITIHNNRTVTLKEGNDKLTVEKGNRTIEVSKGDQTTEVSLGKRDTTIQKNDSLIVKVGNHSIKVDAGKSTIEAMQSIKLKVGPSSIELTPTGITIKAPTIAVQADASLDLKATGNTTLKGGITSVSADSMLDVKGAMATVNGSGMLTLKGGVVMIN